MGTCCCSEFGESYEDSRRTRRTRCSSKLTDDWKQQSHGTNRRCSRHKGRGAQLLKMSEGHELSVTLVKTATTGMPEKAVEPSAFYWYSALNNITALIRWDTLGKLLSVLSVGAVFHHHRNPWRMPVTNVGRSATAEFIDKRKQVLLLEAALWKTLRREKTWQNILWRNCKVVHGVLMMQFLSQVFIQQILHIVYMCFHFHCLFCKTGEQIVLHLFYHWMLSASFTFFSINEPLPVNKLWLQGNVCGFLSDPRDGGVDAVDTVFFCEAYNRPFGLSWNPFSNVQGPTAASPFRWAGRCGVGSPVALLSSFFLVMPLRTARISCRRVSKQRMKDRKALVNERCIELIKLDQNIDCYLKDIYFMIWI